MPKVWDKTVHVGSINSKDLWFLPKRQKHSGYFRELNLKYGNLWNSLEDYLWPSPQPVGGPSGRVTTYACQPKQRSSRESGSPERAPVATEG